MKKSHYSLMLGLLCFAGVSRAQTTQTFNYTGSVQNFTVPACVSEVTITVHGAKGSNGFASASAAGLGANGATVTGTYPVTGGDILNIYVGGAGTTTAGGYNGGGINTVNQSAGGGGASDVRLNGTTLADRIIVAGGGGAGGNGGCNGSNIFGGAGGVGGGNGIAGTNSTAGGGGFPGVATVGGSFGVGCGPYQGLSGANGADGIGGAGGQGTNLCSSALTSGGSGGGGYTGGGGGGAGAAGTVGCLYDDTGAGGGGAGGDCYVSPTMTNTTITPGGATTADGLVTITYTVNDSPTILQSSGDTRCENGVVNLSATASAGTVDWYAAESGGMVLFSGTTYSPTIALTTTFYAEAKLFAGCVSSTRTAVVGTVNYNVTGATTTTSACLSYTWVDGVTYTTSNNTATHVLPSATGCDSLVSLDLTILYSATGTDTKTECNSYTWIDGNTYTASNNIATFNIVGGAANGCDSLVTLDLTILYSATRSDTRTECNSYTWIDGNTYTASNNSATFNIVGGAANGCDSLVTLDLTILYSATGSDTKTECNSYTWIDGNTYTASNNSATLNIVGGAANGCDSLVTLDLTILYSATGSDSKTECNSYTWIDGNTYTASNNSATFNIVGGAASGCDSLVTLDLTINSVSDITTSTSGVMISANNTGATYQWLDCDNNNAVIANEIEQSFTATANGNYAVELTENGCIDTSACVMITTVGIIENSFGDGLIVYPNPTSGNFSINLGTAYENTKIVISDISGKTIESKNISQSQILNLFIEEPAGVYFISIQAADKKAVIRLIKE